MNFTARRSKVVSPRPRDAQHDIDSFVWSPNAGPLFINRSRPRAPPKGYSAARFD